MNFAARAEVAADVERTLSRASALGMDAGDLHVLVVLTTWLGVHHTPERARSCVIVARVMFGTEAVSSWCGRARCLAMKRTSGSVSG